MTVMTPFEKYLAPARERTGFWRVLVGFLLLLGFYFLGAVLVLFVWLTINIVAYGDLALALQQLEGLLGGGGPWSIIVILLTFCGIWPGTWIAVKFLHGQRFWSVFAPEKGLGPRGFVQGVILGLCFSGPSLILALSLTDPTRTDLPLTTWLMFLVPIVLGVFVQAVGEELIFRGYLLQQLAVRFRSPIVWAFSPALVFGLLHYNNPGGPNSDLPEFEFLGFMISEPGALYVLTTAITGSALAALVWRAGSLWPAAGLHVAVNVFSLTMVGAEGTLSGTQLWLFALDDMTRILWINVAASAILLGVLLSPIGRLFAPKPTEAGSPGL